MSTDNITALQQQIEELIKQKETQELEDERAALKKILSSFELKRLKWEIRTTTLDEEERVHFVALCSKSFIQQFTKQFMSYIEFENDIKISWVGYGLGISGPAESVKVFLQEQEIKPDYEDLINDLFHYRSRVRLYEKMVDIFVTQHPKEDRRIK